MATAAGWKCSTLWPLCSCVWSWRIKGCIEGGKRINYLSLITTALVLTDGSIAAEKAPIESNENMDHKERFAIIPLLPTRESENPSCFYIHTCTYLWIYLCARRGCCKTIISPPLMASSVGFFSLIGYSNQNWIRFQKIFWNWKMVCLTIYLFLYVCVREREYVCMYAFATGEKYYCENETWNFTLVLSYERESWRIQHTRCVVNCLCQLHNHFSCICVKLVLLPNSSFCCYYYCCCHLSLYLLISCLHMYVLIWTTIFFLPRYKCRVWRGAEGIREGAREATARPWGRSRTAATRYPGGVWSWADFAPPSHGGRCSRRWDAKPWTQIDPFSLSLSLSFISFLFRSLEWDTN